MKHRLSDHAGFLEIDHSNSPGISESEIPSRLKSSTIAVPEGKKVQTEVWNCSHCQRAIVLNPNRTRARAVCPYCYHYVCDECDKLRLATGTCVPFKKVLDEAENLIARNEEPLIKLTDL